MIAEETDSSAAIVVAIAPRLPGTPYAKYLYAHHVAANPEAAEDFLHCQFNPSSGVDDWDYRALRLPNE